jgi:hypothetical protein
MTRYGGVAREERASLAESPHGGEQGVCFRMNCFDGPLSSRTQQTFTFKPN